MLVETLPLMDHLLLHSFQLEMPSTTEASRQKQILPLAGCEPQAYRCARRSNPWPAPSRFLGPDVFASPNHQLDRIAEKFC